MIGRRLTVLLRAPSQLIRISRQASSIRTKSGILACTGTRSYATPGRPRSTVGEPSRPIKRAAKRVASATGSAAAKPKKKVAAKKKPVKKAKKVLTEEQVAAKKARADVKQVQLLKSTALKPPVIRTANSYAVYNAEKAGGWKYTSTDPATRKEEFARHTREIASSWKQLNASDLEHYNHLANTKQRESNAAYKSWVESHSVEQIEQANKARASLRRRETRDKGKTGIRGKTTSWPAIQDERAVKTAASSYARFNKNRHASGDFKHIRLPEASKLIAQEWKALPDSEKQQQAAAAA